MIGLAFCNKTYVKAKTVHIGQKNDFYYSK